MHGLTRDERENIFCYADLQLEDLLAKLDDQTRRGGYLCVARVNDGIATPVVIALVGELPDLKLERCIYLCQEKMHRLADHPDHASAWQSRDPKEKKYGGAIRAGDFILSFSGLPELADEALILGVAVRLGIMNRDAADLVAEISDNDIWR